MSNMETQLYQTAAWTFEELVFMFCTPELADVVEECEPEATATVSFRGPISGRLVISISGDMLPDLAANMLGQDEPPSDQEQLDALGEVANVICGNVLPKVAGSKEVFYIDAPRVVQGAGNSDLSWGDPAACVSLPLSEGRAELALFVN